jgi:tRNA(Glu) U13 pseudouridine synthase TruD
MHLTGPIPWQDLLLPTPTTDAWRKEHAFLKTYDLTEKDITVFNEWKVFWLRRRLWVQPTNTSVRLQWDDVLLDFTLPAWSYASTLVDSMKKQLVIKDAHGGKKFKKSHKEVKRSKRQ